MANNKDRRRAPAPSATKPTQLRSDTVALDGNLQFTRTHTWAWFVLGSHPWAYTGAGEREALLGELTKRLAEMAPCQIHLRVSYRRRNAEDWARRYWARAHERGGRIPDVPEAKALPAGTFRSYVEAQRDAQQRADLYDKVVMLGVSVASGLSLRKIRQFRADPASNRRLTEAIDKVSQVIGAPGMSGCPAKPVDVEWLLHRSWDVGMEEPPLLGKPTWEATDIGHFFDNTTVTATPYGRELKLVTRRPGSEPVERYATVLTMGRMDGFDVPESADPWLTWSDELSNSDDPQNVDWSARVELIPGDEVAGTIRFRGNVLADQARYFASKERPLQPSLAKAYEASVAAVDDIDSGNPVYTVRAYGYYRAIVTAPTLAQLRRRVHTMVNAYSPRILLEQTSGQWGAFLETVPGQRLARTGYLRRLRAADLAASFPHVDGMLGDRLGMYLGFTAEGVRSAVNFESRVLTERNKGAGFVAVVGRQGSGKSAIIGEIAYDAVRRGIRTIIMDPSGLLAPLADLPEIAPYSEVLDLAKAAPGTLNPWSVIPAPNRTHYGSQKEWQEAATEADLARRELAIDIATMVIAHGALDMQVRAALGNAVKEVGGEPHHTLWDVVDVLESKDDSASRVAAQALRDVADQPRSRTYFPPREVRPIGVAVSSKRAVLTIITLSNIRPPAPGTDPSTWTIAERTARPALHLAGFLAQREVYELRRDLPKVVCQDEGSFVEGAASLKTLNARLLSDSRKFNVTFLIANQNCGGMLSDPDIVNHVAAAFIGYVSSTKVQEDCMRLLGVPLGYDFETILGSLPIKDSPYRFFLHRDAYGRVRLFAADRSWHPRMAEALTTDTGAEDAADENWDPDTPLSPETVPVPDFPLPNLDKEYAS